MLWFLPCSHHNSPVEGAATAMDFCKENVGIVDQLHVAAIPYPGRGHINPMINICRLLAGKGLLISFVVTDEWLELIGSRSASLPPNLRLCPIPNVIPSERTRGTDMSSFVRAVYTKMEAPVEELIDRLQPPIDCIMTSTALSWVRAIAEQRNVPLAPLWSDSPTVFLAFHHLENPDADLDQFKLSGKQHAVLAYLPRASSSIFRDDQSTTFPQNLIRDYKNLLLRFLTSNALLFTSFHELDQQVVDALRSQLPLPVYPIGPSIPYTTLLDEPTDNANATWLDSQPLSSVIYVALGSFAPVSADQMEELANGLKMSGVRYLWVVREDAERMQGMAGGMGVVVPWCEQLRTLVHPSVGGFLTHCGWNSVLEGVYAGLSMLTFPLAWDQYPNSKLIVDDWRIGLRLRDEEEGEAVVVKEHVAKMVKKLMDVESVERDGMRARAKELQGRCREAVGDGGSLSRNLDDFVQGLVSSKRARNGAM